MPSKVRSASLALMLALPAAAHAHGPNAHGDTAFGRPGDEGKPNRIVEIVMTESDGKMSFSPNQIEVTQGQQLRFKIRNEGALDHEFILATHEENLKHADDMKKNPEMEHDEPNMKRVATNGTKEVLWRFTKVGKFHIGCLIPGHLEAGMEAWVTVKPAAANPVIAMPATAKPAAVKAAAVKAAAAKPAAAKTATAKTTAVKAAAAKPATKKSATNPNSAENPSKSGPSNQVGNP